MSVRELIRIHHAGGFYYSGLVLMIMLILIRTVASTVVFINSYQRDLLQYGEMFISVTGFKGHAFVESAKI